MKFPVTIELVSGSSIRPKYPVDVRPITLSANTVFDVTLKVSAFTESLSMLSINEPPIVLVVSSHDTMPKQATSKHATIKFLFIKSSCYKNLSTYPLALHH